MLFAHAVAVLTSLSYEEAEERLIELNRLHWTQVVSRLLIIHCGFFRVEHSRVDWVVLSLHNSYLLNPLRIKGSRQEREERCQLWVLLNSTHTYSITMIIQSELLLS